MLPSAETVGLSSGCSVLIFGPRFSIFTMVDAVMMFSFCGFSSPRVSLNTSWAPATCMQKHVRKKKVVFFTTLDFSQSNAKCLFVISFRREITVRQARLLKLPSDKYY